MSLTWLVDHRSLLEPILDQGARPTCLSCAVSAAHYGLRNVSQSIEYLQFMSKAKPGGAGSFQAAQAVLEADGQPPESQWPYDACADETILQPPATTVGPFCTAVVEVVSDPTSGRLLAELENGSLPVVGLVTTPAFMVNTGKIVARREAHLGRHAVLLVGIARYAGPPVAEVANGDLIFCVRNSWGTGWGHGGYGYIASAVWDDIIEVAALLT